MITVGLITKEKTLGDFVYDDFTSLSDAIEAAQLIMRQHAHERATIGEDQVFGWAHDFIVYNDDEIIFPK